MQNSYINNELSINFQDYFKLLSHEDACKLFTKSVSNIWAIKSEERHCLLVICWQKRNKIIMKMTNLKKITQTNIKMLKKKIPDYEEEEVLAIQIAMHEATLTSYHYTKDNLGQSARTIMMICNNTIYNISFYSNSAYIENNENTFKDIIENMEIIENIKNV